MITQIKPSVMTPGINSEMSQVNSFKCCIVFISIKVPLCKVVLHPLQKNVFLSEGMLFMHPAA